MAADTAPPEVPDSLLARLRADPAHAPEHIALAAAERHGPAAAAWVAGKRTSDTHSLARKAKRKHAAMARYGGAAGGVGGAFTMLPDIAGLIWIQSRMVFFVAAAYGYDPLDRMRPAELLVLYELYDDPVAAREALDGTGRTVAAAAVARATERRDDEALLAKLARMGLKRGARKLAGRVVPGLAILTNSVGNERSTRDLADRAIAFYAG